MLRCPGTSVVLVSQELSFEDLPTFGKFFRLHTGFSPREYQKKVLASSALSHPEKG
jgi:AraC-like DNA-binding protein